MIAAFLLVQAAAGVADESRALAGIDTCVAATTETGIDERVLTDRGWIRVSTEPEELKGVRTFGSPDGATIAVTDFKSAHPGCVVRSSGTYAPLIMAITTKFGAPLERIMSLNIWQVAEHQLSVNAVDKRGMDRLVAISFQKKVSP
jgi:hypothetical protein